MSSLDLELDSRMDALELEWRRAYEQSIIARADLQFIAEIPDVNPAIIEGAFERLIRIEASKTRILGKIERLEDSLLGLG